MSFFLTGTDTGVGKTHTATCLLRLLRSTGLRCAGFKPICCGDREDADLLLAASSEGITIDEVNPVWLRTPAAPFAASLIEGVEIKIEPLLERLDDLRRRYDVVVVEGVGGWLVPLRRDYFVSDLAREMRLPVLVVARNRLGCLNHTLLTVRSVADAHLSCAGVVLNSVSGAEDFSSTTNASVLAQIVDVPILSALTVESGTLPPEWRQLLCDAAKFGASPV